MAFIDGVIIGGFLILLFFFGTIFFKWIKNPDDFYVAGRMLPPFILAATLTASNVNLYSFIGQAGKAYEQGISIIWHTWTGNMALVLAGLFIIPIFRRLKIRTIPEFLEKRYGLGMRVLIAVLWIFRLSFWLGIVLYVASTAAVAITGTGEGSYIIWALVFSVLTIAYTTAGGMWSVAFTDVLQFTLMMIGALIFFPLIMAKAGGFSVILQELPSTYLNLVPQTGQFNWTFIIAIFFLGIQWACTDQGMLQRAFGAKDVKSVAKGLVLAGIITTPFALLWYMPGLAAKVIDPKIAQVDQVIPTMLTQIIPSGILGLILCGLLAAQMSTIDSNLNASATLFTNDIYQRVFNKKASTKQILAVVRITTILIGVFMLLFSFIAKKLGAVNAYLLLIGIMDMPLFVVAVIYGIFWKKVGWQGAFAGYISGAITGAFCVFVIFADNVNATTYATFLSAAAALLFTPIFSIIFKDIAREKQVETIWEAKKTSKEEIETGTVFHIIPKSSLGKLMLGICMIGLLVFLGSAFLGGLGFCATAGWLSVSSMGLFFAGGFYRLFFD
jgi:SSS family solute:Na+ symporter